MTEDINLPERMGRFFGSLSHELHAGEQIELLWRPRGEERPPRRECLPDFEQVSLKAVTLGPEHDVFVQAVTEPGTAPWEAESTQLLAYWYRRPRRSGDPRSALGAGAAEMRPLPYAEPSWAFIQCYPDGDSTCEAGWFYYRSRCPIRGELEAEGRSPELEW